jgi:hypothetical protein
LKYLKAWVSCCLKIAICCPFLRRKDGQQVEWATGGSANG